MIRRTERILENIPVGSLGLVALEDCEALGQKVNDYLVKWGAEMDGGNKDETASAG